MWVSATTEYSSTLKTEVAGFSEKQVMVHQITLHYMPQDCNPHSHHYEKLIRVHPSHYHWKRNEQTNIRSALSHLHGYHNLYADEPKNDRI
jgi:hypothetical protein